MEPKIIRIIDGRYNLQFTLEDGGCITADGKLYRLQYLDATHFRAVNAETGHGTFFHICQFGERVIDQGILVEKMDADAANLQTKE